MGSRIPADHLSQLAAFISAKVDYLSKNIGELTLSERQALESRYSAQLKFVNALLSQSSSKNSTSALSLDEDKDNEQDDEYMTVKYPSYIRSIPVKQGPFLLQPSPRELDDSEESIASDILYVRIQGQGTDAELGCIILAYSDGKVDICLDVEKVEAQWSSGGRPEEVSRRSHACTSSN